MPRGPVFAYPGDLPVVWTPRCPEVAIGANALSMLMPHVEPWVVDVVRTAADELDPADAELVRHARAYAAQEVAHHTRHRGFNEILVARRPALTRVDAGMARCFGFLRRHSGTRTGVAFAAGFETIAYAGARWTDRRMTRLFVGADPEATSLLLWHLAEEVEHKSVAWDVHGAIGGGRVRYLVGALAALVLLVVWSAIAATVMLAGERRLLYPVAWWRLVTWGLSLLADMTPLVVLACRRDHHPGRLADPGWYRAWLDDYDPRTHRVADLVGVSGSCEPPPPQE